MPYQRGWKSCYPCTGVWLAPDTKDKGGKCANPAGEHDGVGANIFYEIYYRGRETPERPVGGQENWRCCRKCLVLFFDGNPSSGFCAAGGSHDSVGSKNYILEHRLEPFPELRWRMLINWRWCRQCQQICQPDWLVSKDFLCPRNKGATHDTTGSGYYALGEHTWI